MNELEHTLDPMTPGVFDLAKEARRRKQMATGSMLGLYPAMDLSRRVDAIPYWYHKIELPGGVVTPGWAPLCAERYSIPQDLTGKRVLDIGAWDGYWTWEAIKRGAAEVVAIDDFSDTLGAPIDRKHKWQTFDLCREAFGFTERVGDSDSWRNDAGQQVARIEMSVYDLPVNPVNRVNEVGPFDVIFFFGTIYHLKHPLLALEKIASVCDGALYVESACLDSYSVYRGGLGHGYAQNDVVMEFYPGDQYGGNAGNWWVPTLQCLGAMMSSVGFQEVEAWPLTDAPTHLAQCRGFLSGTKDPAKHPAMHPPDVDAQVATTNIRVAAVMSVPRLGFNDMTNCALRAFTALHIPVLQVQGAYWSHAFEQGLCRAIDEGADIILALDYDTIFERSDVEHLLRLMMEHPDAGALVPIQVKRGSWTALMTVRGRSGQPLAEVPVSEFAQELRQIATGHFGLTALRVKDLMDVPHPWFKGEPNADGFWEDGKIDDDIWFWRQFEKAGKRVCSANRVPVGHLELMIAWPDQNGGTIFQEVSEYRKHGKPAQCWQ